MIYAIIRYPLIYDLGSSECDASQNWSAPIKRIANIMRNLEDYRTWVGNGKKPFPQFVPVDSGRWERKSKEHAGRTANQTRKRKGEVCERNRTMALAGSRKNDRRHCTRGTFPSFGEARCGPDRDSNIVGVHRCRLSSHKRRVGCVASRDHREWDDTLAQGQ